VEETWRKRAENVEKREEKAKKSSRQDTWGISRFEALDHLGMGLGWRSWRGICKPGVLLGVEGQGRDSSRCRWLTRNNRMKCQRSESSAGFYRLCSGLFGLVQAWWLSADSSQRPDRRTPTHSPTHSQ